MAAALLTAPRQTRQQRRQDRPMGTTQTNSKPSSLLTNGLTLAVSGDYANQSRILANTVGIGGKPAPTLRWVEAFSLDVPLLDDQHRQLLEHVKVAIAALQGARERDAAHLLESIKDMAQGHFNDEEILMYELAFPGYVNHVEQHRRLVLRLEHLQASLALRPAAPHEAIHDLRAWFALHLIDYDRALAAFVNARQHRAQDSAA